MHVNAQGVVQVGESTEILQFETLANCDPQAMQ